jgi:hypothetical protein
MLCGKTFLAHVANEGALARMSSLVLLQMAGRHKGFLAEAAS